MAVSESRQRPGRRRALRFRVPASSRVAERRTVLPPPRGRAFNSTRAASLTLARRTTRRPLTRTRREPTSGGSTSAAACGPSEPRAARQRRRRRGGGRRRLCGRGRGRGDRRRPVTVGVAARRVTVGLAVGVAVTVGVAVSRGDRRRRGRRRLGRVADHHLSRHLGMDGADEREASLVGEDDVVRDRVAGRVQALLRVPVVVGRNGERMRSVSATDRRSARCRWAHGDDRRVPAELARVRGRTPSRPARRPPRRRCRGRRRLGAADCRDRGRIRDDRGGRRPSRGPGDPPAAAGCCVRHG